MAHDRFTLVVDTGADGSVKLVWTAYCGTDDMFAALPYFVPFGQLSQASEEVRKILRRLAAQDFVEEQGYRVLLRDLRDCGSALFRNLFPASGGDLADEIAGLLRDSAVPGAVRASLTVTICDERVHVPWSFVCDPRVPEPQVALPASIADFGGFWLSSYKLVTQYQAGYALAAERRPSSRALYALHETLFTSARQELRRCNAEMDRQLDILLGTGALHAFTWTECCRHWPSIAEDYDSVLYMFGHSDGEHIVLADGVDTIEYRLAASSFSSRFPKERRTRSASVCILNGCRTAAPAPAVTWPASFLKATLGPGFFGFIGTEIEVPNDFASLYGVKLLSRLILEGEALGEAFDAIRCDRDLFPRSLLYSCFANRRFKLPVVRSLVDAVEAVS